ncbi:hypothetical protein KCU83_g7123, partial [Aureobasidium melanogenum]
MNGQGSFHSNHINLSVYNSPKDSDIILKCGNHQFYAHRAILRMWSPFFERSLNPGFPVAKSAIFSIDQDDPYDQEYFAAMLKHIYGMPFGDHPMNDPYDFDFCRGVLKNIISVYVMADKYDIPAVRDTAMLELERFLYSGDALPNDIEADIFRVLDWIATICGPGAPQLADPSLRNALCTWVSEKFDILIQDPGYISKIKDGSLLDTDLNAKLLLNLGAEIEHLKET